MRCRELLLILWLLVVKIATEQVCISRPIINVLEGEPFRLQPCSSSLSNENGTASVRWFKNSPTRGRVELRPSSSPRITLHDYALEFWPVESDDEGSYLFQMGNDTQEWRLMVIRRNKSSCFTEKLVKSKTIKVNKTLEIRCESSYFQEMINRTSLYKNCEKLDENNKQSLLMLKNAKFQHQGYYTCVHSLHHNGKLHNITKTYNITIIKDLSALTPVLLGPKLNYVEVELGKDVELNCSALLNKKDNIYWNFRREKEPYTNIYEEKEKTTWISEGKPYASVILRIEKVNENNLNFLYNCTVVNAEGTDTKSFILLRRDTSDIPGHVFTGGMIVAILISVSVVCLVTLCVIYRVDLVLFYRRVTGRNETLTDGKTYDAFVSYLKEYLPENEEEYTFAVETLPRVLEKHFGYKLCIFERDVAPGGAVVDEIHSLIQKSRRLIIVLSKSYMSNEVRYELESGLHEALVERKIKIILIQFTPASDFGSLPQSLKLLKSHRVLKWKADKALSYDSRFWKNLLYLMPAKAIQPDRREAEVLPVLSAS